MEIHILDTRLIKQDPAAMGALDASGRLIVYPAEYWKQFNPIEISAFCVQHGIYCVPTLELVNWLRQEIADQFTIEIGAGNGVLAEALGIVGTDNKMQQWPEIAMMLAMARQATVNYGPEVLTYGAYEAIQAFKPRVVIGAWVTHRYNPRSHWRGGNAFGVVEEDLLQHAKYYFIGNRAVHASKPILELAHKQYTFPWLISRAVNPEENFISVWEQSRSE